MKCIENADQFSLWTFTICYFTYPGIYCIITLHAKNSYIIDYNITHHITNLVEVFLHHRHKKARQSKHT